MKKNVFVIFIIALFISTACYAKVYVNGYYRKDGTYVAPHYRSDPDGIVTNNYSYPGNYNPNTGTITGGTNYSSPNTNPWPVNSYSTTNLTSTNYSYTPQLDVNAKKVSYPVKINGTDISTYSWGWEPLTYNDITYIPMTSSVIKELGLTSTFNQTTGFELNKNNNQNSQVLLIVLDPSTMKFHSTTECAGIKNIDEYRSCPNCIQ